MLEPYEGKLSRTVLRGKGSSNAPALPNQLIENKQRFISQIMTSKSLARSAEDVDEATLSYAEMKAIATGNPLIKEKMDIDVKLERIKISLSEFLKSHEQLEHKVKNSYPQRIFEKQQQLNDLKRDIEIVQQNTSVDKDGNEKFSIILNGKTFEDKKAAATFIAEIIQKNKDSAHAHCPLMGLSGEYKGLHISTKFDFNLSRELILLTGKSNSLRNSSNIAGDNINRIIEMANGREKSAESTQRDIDELNRKIQVGNEELAAPFPQQEEYERLTLRAAELMHILNEDSETIEKDKADIQSEKNQRISNILNEMPENESVCAIQFFTFAKHTLESSQQNWTPSLDETAIQYLVSSGFKKDDISDTILKFSPTVPSKETVYNMVEDCTRRTASCR